MTEENTRILKLFYAIRKSRRAGRAFADQRENGEKQHGGAENLRLSEGIIVPGA